MEDTGGRCVPYVNPPGPGCAILTSETVPKYTWCPGPETASCMGGILE